MNKKPKKESPLKQRPLNQPGDSVYEQLLELLFDKFLFWAVASITFWIVCIHHWFLWLSKNPWHPVLSTIIATVVTAITTIQIIPAMKKAKRLRLGLQGEMVVGQRLEELRSAGYQIFHNIIQKGFNIDHVIIGPGGVFVIETKTISKSTTGKPQITYDGHRVLIDGMEPDRDPVAQAKANAKCIGEMLTKFTGQNVAPRPVVIFPGWWVENPRKNAEVLVFHDDYFMKFISGRPNVLKPTDITLLASALETHIRASA